jgi:hypothetical protein
LTLFPVAIALWQLLRDQRPNFSTSYFFGFQDNWIEIFNNNGRGVRVTWFEIFWKVPAGIFSWREQKVLDAWQDDEVWNFDIPLDGRQKIPLPDNPAEFGWPHPQKRAKLCMRISTNGSGKSATVVILDQAKNVKD